MFIRLPSLDPAGFSFPEGVWEILRLSERDFWIQINSNGKTYLIKFVKID